MAPPTTTAMASPASPAETLLRSIEAEGSQSFTTIAALDTVEVQSLNGSDGKIAYVWLNRPQQRNACSVQLLEDIAAAYGMLSRHYEVRVIVMAGRGKSFCAGADLNTPPTKGTTYLETYRQARHQTKCWDRAGAAIRGSDAITIARVHGHASGGGLGIAFVNDLVIMEHNTRVWLPELEVSGLAVLESTQFLTLKCGFASLRHRSLDRL